MKTRFEWDAAKAASNLTKHRVSFELAVRVFADPFLLTNQDRTENGEHRWQSIGMVDGVVVLLVAHTVWRRRRRRQHRNHPHHLRAEGGIQGKETL